MSALDKSAYRLEVVRPVWMPFNDAAINIITSLFDDLGFPSSGPKADKYGVVVASLLKATQAVERSHDAKKPTYLGVKRGASAWSQYPLVGKDIARKAVDRFLAHFGAALVEGSGDSGLHKDDNGKWRKDAIMSMYDLDPSRLPAGLSEAKFIQVGLPLVKVNIAENRQKGNKRKAVNEPKPFLNASTAKALSEQAFTASESRIRALNALWLEHPLILPNGHAAASATRIFHDSRFDAGGRLYGAWTGLNKKANKLSCTIDGEPVCELDISASQPTLFSSLLGYKLGGLDKNNEWVDVYAELSRLAATEYGWTVVDDTIDVIDLHVRNRNVAKSVVMALIGSGIPLKSKATEEMVEEFGLTPKGWTFFRDRLLQTIPALEELQPRYDRTGKLDGYLNGAGFLSYHESEMMLATLEKLMKVGIPAYPVHDCLIVKVKDSILAAKTFREVIYQYCKNLSGIEIMVPLSIKAPEGIPKNLLPSDNNLTGVYLN